MLGECISSLVFKDQKCHYFILLKVEFLLLPLICAKCIFTEKRLSGGIIFEKVKATAATTSFSKCARCQISVKSRQNTNAVVDKQILTYKGTIFRNKRFMPDKNDLAKCFKNQNLPHSGNKKIPYVNFYFVLFHFSLMNALVYVYRLFLKSQERC